MGYQTFSEMINETYTVKAATFDLTKKYEETFSNIVVEAELICWYWVSDLSDLYSLDQGSGLDRYIDSSMCFKLRLLEIVIIMTKLNTQQIQWYTGSSECLQHIVVL